MGGRGSYIKTGGFTQQEYFTKEVLYWEEEDFTVKIIEHKTQPNKSLPEFSNTPNAIYAHRNANGKITQIRIYDSNRMSMLDIDLDHENKAGIPPNHMHQHTSTPVPGIHKGVQMLVPDRSYHQAISAENLARYASLIRKLSPKTKLISVKPTK